MILHEDTTFDKLLFYKWKINFHTMPHGIIYMDDHWDDFQINLVDELTRLVDKRIRTFVHTVDYYTDSDVYDSD